MYDKVKQYIIQNSLITPNQTILVAVSGGRDSVALLSILHKFDCEIIALHCNFHIRKGESDNDQQFVKELCSKHNIPLIIRHFDTQAYSEQHGVSIEMAARELRYQWFENMRQKLGAQSIAVAHHKDDQAETVLLNLIRGTGLRGLCGMQNQNNHIIRPLLCVNRLEIEQYLEQNDLQYVDDSTNADTAYRRNKLRHDILPEIKKINPNIVETLCNEAEIFKRTANIYNYYINQEIDNICTESPDGKEIDIEKLSKHPMAQELLYEIIRDYGFNWEQCQLIYSNIYSQSGKRFLSQEYEIIIDRSKILIFHHNNSSEPPQIQIVKRDRVENERFPAANTNKAFFDIKVLDQTLSLRHWQYGDYFFPLGMKQSKKLSD